MARINAKKRINSMNQPATISKDFELEGIKNLQLETFSGDIQLIGHEAANIKVEVCISVRSWQSLFLTNEIVSEFELDYETLDLKFKQEADTLAIFAKPNYFNFYNWFNFQKISFRVFLPKTINAISKTWGGDVSLKNLDGVHQFTTWGGNMLIEGSKGILNGKTMGGKIEVINCDAKIDAKTMGGKIFLIENKGEINLKTLGGNIEIVNNQGNIFVKTAGGNISGNGNSGDLKCSTAGGNVRFFDVTGNIGATTMGGNMSVEMKSVKDYLWLDTKGGNINVVLPRNQGLNLDISGSRIDMPTLQNFVGFKQNGQLQGKINGDGPSVKLKTSGGKIRLSQADFPQKQAIFQKKQADIQEKQENVTQKQETINSNFADFSPQKEKNTQTFFEKSNKQISSNDYISSRFFDLLFAFAFCLLLTYGLSSIFYFTLELINPQNLTPTVSKGIILSNIANGFSALFSVYIFIFLLENIVQKKWFKYLIISTITFFLCAFSQILVGIFYWNKLNLGVLKREENNFNNLYILLPIIVSCVYYYSWQRTRKITRKISEQEYQLLNLEKLKTRADLSALQARINPHFLYNSLNSIASLVHSDPDKAEEMTILLSKLFRYTTDRNNEHFNSIADELEIVRTYLSIEQVRFGDRLTFAVELEKGLESFQIPRLLLQPIVENAIKHGISKSSDAGKIEVKIYEKGNQIMLSVHDSGQLFPEEIASGYGLRSIQDKLRLIYGNDANFEIQNDTQYKAVVIAITKK